MCEDCGQHGDSTGPVDGLATFYVRRTPGGPTDSPEALRVDSDGTVRLAVTGKGGVGKTTLATAIATHLAADFGVVAIDADPDMNLAGTLGVEAPPPITTQKTLITDRVGGDQGFFSLLPDVRDVLETHSTDFGDAGRLLTIGTPGSANSGCMCPENSFIRSMVSTVLSEDFVVMDMEAGVEHLGRGTAEAVDAMIVVVEPSAASIETAVRIQDLADDLGIETLRGVVNKSRGNGETVRSKLDMPVVATLPYDESIAEASLKGMPPIHASPRLNRAAAQIVSVFDRQPIEAGLNE